MIDSTTAKPLKYKQVEQEVRKLIARAKLDDKLPTERELANMFGCNFLTVRKGLRPLVDEGLLHRRVGSGTFVARVPEEVQRARSGRGRRVTHLGILIPSAGDLYSYRVVRAVADAALDQGVELRSAWAKEFAATALATVRDMAQSGCKALIIPWFHTGESDQVRQFIQESPIPVVLPQILPGLEHLCFEKQTVFGRSAAVEVEVLCEYFLRLGARHIHFIGPDQVDAPILQQKLTAYACYASKAGFEAKFGLIDQTLASVTALAEREKKFAGDLAIIAYDDTHAIRFLTAMHKLGFSAPRDFRIIGHNDTGSSRNTDPPLSTLREDFEYIGGAMLKAAAALAHGGSEQSKATPDPKLIVRGSCGGWALAQQMDVPRLELELDLSIAEHHGAAKA